MLHIRLFFLNSVVVIMMLECVILSETTDPQQDSSRTNLESVEVKKIILVFPERVEICTNPVVK